MINNLNKITGNAINSYKTIKKSNASDSAALEKKQDGNFDTVEIDFSQAINLAKSAIAGKLNDDADITKIRFLQAQYEAGTCPVSAEKIAQSIIGKL
ncbi:MAG: flagellar biosynthesis anti-sigma factor FlgM [Oscillospiraceae bacterium]|nr:flagellar biosynthesis anti-sigma factor FlgM [Oscillospiraceae bacterium]